MGNMSNMDSVFDGAMNNDIEFDTIFDQEDSLIDIVEGFGNGTDPLDDYLEAAEGTEEAEVLDTSVDEKEIGKESDADKFTADAEEEYHDGEKGPKPDETSVEDTIDKVVESNMDIDDILDDEDDIFDEACVKDEAEVDLGPEAEDPTESCKVKKEEADMTIDSIEEEIEKEAKGAEKDMCKDDPDCAVKEAEEMTIDSIEEEIEKEAKGAEKDMCKDDPDCAVKEAEEMTIDSIEEEIEKESQDAEKDMCKDDPDCAVKEAGDPEVEKVERAEEESDEDLIDIAMGQEKNDSAEEKYAYDISDEDLIDIAMNND